MRMIPASCASRTSSPAERRVFSLLERTELTSAPGATCFHSLSLSRHDYKRVAELDFVLVDSRFMLVLEVKGGRIACEAGLWVFTDRYDAEHRRSESPFEQARSGMYSLVKRLRAELGPVIRRFPVGYGVVTPDVDFSVVSVEWDPEMVFDAGTFRGASELAAPLERIVAYWTTKTREPEALSPPQLRRLLGLVRPDFERLPSLRNRADELDCAFERLTDEQYRQLDLITENARIVCEGGAGTGKTFLAAELARREAEAGRSVGFLTSTAMQRSFVASRLDQSGVTVLTPDGLGARVFDVLVVDEGQDLVNLDLLSTLDQAVHGGLEQGRWRFFLDSNRQIGLVGRFDPEALDYLRTGCGAALARLTQNCRNTRDIVIQTKLLTGADLGSPSAGHGPPVTFEYFDSTEARITLLDGELDRLREGGVEPGDVTILSPGPLSESVAVGCRPSRRKRLVELETAVDWEWPCRRTSFCSVSMFKGLENQFVLLVDVERLDEEADLNLLYVAMSRARAGLWIALDRSLENRVEDLCRQHYDRVMEDARHDGH